MMARQSPGGPNLPGKKVPGGKRIAGNTQPLAALPAGSVNVGRGRGIVGSGTADKHGRSPAEQRRTSSGNFGGGYAGAKRGSKRPPGANARG